MSQATCLRTEEIESLIVEFISDDLAGDESLAIDLDENLLTGGLVDSVGIVRLVAHLKDRLDVSIPPTDLVPDNFRTIRIMASFMQSRQDG